MPERLRSSKEDAREAEELQRRRAFSSRQMRSCRGNQTLRKRGPQGVTPRNGLQKKHGRKQIRDTEMSVERLGPNTS